MSYSLTLTINSPAQGFNNTMIAVESFSFGEQNPVTIGSGGASAGKSQVTPLQINKRLDVNSVGLYKASFKGAALQSISLSLTKAGSSAPDAQFILTGAFVSSINDSGNRHGGLFPMEQVSFLYERIEYFGAPNSFTYDLQTAKGT